MRYNAKRDANHAQIASALRAVGADVLELFDVDIVCSFRGRAYLIEVKNSDLVSKRKGGPRESAMRAKQVRLRAIFGDQYLVIFSSEGALRAIGAC